MKTNILPTEFRPVSITLKMETKAELDAIASMFNCNLISDTLAEMGAHVSNLVSCLLREAGADIHKSDAFARKIADHEWIKYHANK